MPAVGLCGQERVTLALAFRATLSEDELVEEALKVLGWDADAPCRTEFPVPGLIYVTADSSALEMIPSETAESGEYYARGEDLPRGLYILEPIEMCEEIRKEQHWVVRLTGCNTEPSPIPSSELREMMHQCIKVTLVEQPRAIDLKTEKWCEPQYPGAVSAERYWELFCRNQYISGLPIALHDLINPWSISTQGCTQTSHNEKTGQPFETTKYREVVQDAFIISAPPILEQCYKEAVAKLTTRVRDLTEKEIEGSMELHTFPKNALRMVKEQGRLLNPFGVEEPLMTSLRIVTMLPDSTWAHPREIMNELTAQMYLDPVVARTEVTQVKMPGASASIAVTRVIAFGVKSLNEVGELTRDYDTDVKCSVWKYNDSLRPKEGVDYWKGSGCISMTPIVTDAEAANSLIIEMIEQNIKAKLDQATTDGMANANYSRVASATEKLITARVRQRAAGIEGQIPDREQGSFDRDEREDAWREWTEEEEVRGPKKPKVEEPSAGPDIWNETVRIRLINENTEALVTYVGIERWKKDNAPLDAGPTIEHLVKAMIFTGYMSPNLGLSNRVFETRDSTAMGELHLTIKGKRIRKNMLERVPLWELWEMIAEKGAKPEVGFTLVSKRESVNTFTAVWDEEDEGYEDDYDNQLEADADRAWQESQDEEKVDQTAKVTASELATLDGQSKQGDQGRTQREASAMDDTTTSSGSKRKADEVEPSEKGTETMKK